MITYSWRGHIIEVDLRPFGKYLWLAGGFVVTVDGQPFYPPANEGLSLRTRTEFQVEDDGETYPGVVQSIGMPVWTPRQRYMVWVAGEEIANDRQLPKRWYISLPLGILLTALVTFALTRFVLFLVSLAFE